MSLKPFRKVQEWDISFIYDSTVTADQDNGVIVSLKTGGSGEAMDSSNAVCVAHATGSGVMALGVLVPKIKYDDVSAVPRNFQRNEVPPGSKVEIIRRGEVLTNKYQGTPTAGANAELSASGFFALGTHTQTTGNVVVGKFMGTADEDGYVRVFVNCPAT